MLTQKRQKETSNTSKTEKLETSLSMRTRNSKRRTRSSSHHANDHQIKSSIEELTRVEDNIKTPVKSDCSKMNSTRIMKDTINQMDLKVKSQFPMQKNYEM